MRKPRKPRPAQWTPLALGLVLILVAGTAGSPVAAQEQQEETAEERPLTDAERRRQELEPKKAEDSTRPFFYLFPTAVQGGIDTTRIGDESFSDTVTVLVPFVVSARASDERGRFYAIYEPQVEHFAEHTEFNSWNHSAAAAFDYEISPRFTLGAGGSYLQTADPTRAITELPLVLDRGEFLSARAYVSLGYQLSRRTIADITVDRGMVRYDALPGKPDVGIDSVGSGVIVGLSHEVNQFHTLAFRYAYVREEALEDAEDLPEDLALLLPLVPQHGVDVGWTYDAARGLTISLSAGMAYGERASWLGSATVEKEWRYIRLLVGYQRLLSSYENLARTPTGEISVDPRLPLSTIGSVADIVGASIEGRSGRLQIAGRLQMSLSSFAGEGPYMDGLSAGAGVKFALSDRIQPYIQTEYITQGLSEAVGLRRSRGRYAAGLVLVLGPGPEKTSLQLELERRRTLLPYAGAKRPW